MLDQYRKKLITPEEAANLIRSGDRVQVPAASAPLSLIMALVARKEELRDVQISLGVPLQDYPWFEPGWDESFRTEVWFVNHPAVRQLINKYKSADYRICPSSLLVKSASEREFEARKADFVLVDTSMPDKHGYCSFDAALWDKKDQIKYGKKVIAETHPDYIRTYGDNFIHVSEIDYFVEVGYPRSPLILMPLGVDKEAEAVAGFISTRLLKDRDTVQIGAGGIAEQLPQAGLFDNKHDLGWHTERIPRGCVKMMQEKRELFTGKYKTLHAGKAVATMLALTPEEVEYVEGNVAFELYGVSYVNSVTTIARHDNMVAINSAIAVDLTGQISSEAIGSIMYTGMGGLLDFAVGAVLSKGGRSIIVLPSTGKGGTLSRIVPRFEPGTPVTVPRGYADYVVTEYGIASLFGKTQRQRAEELIATAHPDFRLELKQEAKRLFW